MWIGNGQTTPETWRTRGWLLARKVARNGSATANDRRVAMLLLDSSYAGRAYHAEIKGHLEAIAYGDDDAT